MKSEFTRINLLPNYEMYQAISKPTFKSHKTQLVPYYAWSNRGQAEMTVFMPVIWN